LRLLLSGGQVAVEVQADLAKSYDLRGGEQLPHLSQCGIVRRVGIVRMDARGRVAVRFRLGEFEGQLGGREIEADVDDRHKTRVSGPAKALSQVITVVGVVQVCVCVDEFHCVALTPALRVLPHAA